MDICKTILQFEFRPVDYFETPFQDLNEKYTLNIENGKAEILLSEPQSVIPELFQKEITDKIHAILNARMVIKHELFELGSINVQQHYTDGKINTHRTITGVASIIKLKTYAPDIILKDADGKIIKDTKADRIAQEETFMKLSAGIANKNPLVNKLFDSYKSAVSDSENELVHLYEFIDALKKHYGSKKEALKQLGFAESKWDRLHGLSNNEPIKEGRHRGSYTTLRHATDEELTEAREIAREMINAVVNSN